LSERKKADRLAKRLRTQLDTATDETDKKRIAADLRTAEIDGVYARFFPHRERYISLYPVAGSGAEGEEEKGKEGKAAEATSKAVKALKVDRPPIWYDIERAERKGMSALVSIRERNTNAKPAKELGLTDLPSRSSAKKEEKSTQEREGKGTGATEKKNRGKHEKPRADKEDIVAEDSDSDGGFFE